jgi:hypothetical protein
MELENQRLYYYQNMPKGHSFYDWIFSKDKQKEDYTIEIFETDKEFYSLETYETISEFFKILYKISTCGFGCSGGSHIIEYITGRGYNLGLSAMKLLRLGFYDESLSLIRSISEIVNLFALFGVDSNSLEIWYNLDDRGRINEFSPAKVRNKIGKLNLPCPIYKEYYSKMCEVAVHVNPLTRPQGNNHLDRALVGGFVVKEQSIAILNDLATNLYWLSIVALRNSVDKQTFLSEVKRLEKFDEKLGKLSIENLDEYFSKNDSGKK